MAVHSSPFPRSHSPALLNLPSPTTDNSSSTSLSPRLTIEDMLKILNEKTRFVSFSIDHDDFEQSSLKLLKLVFPEWFTSTNANHLKLVHCTDGITNKLMKCKNLSTGQVILIRAYGKKSELMIDRQAELLTFAKLQEYGLAPPLYCRFENGFVYGYVPGIPLKPAQLADPNYFPLVASKMARWHRVDCIPGSRAPRLFKNFWKWLKNVPKAYDRPGVQAKFESGIDLDLLESEMRLLEDRVKNSDCQVVFCHNDLLSANIIYNPESQDAAFIDYEYGSYNYRSFDIANHFCEFAGFECDYSLYPKEPFQRDWIKAYLIHYGEVVTDQSVQKVIDEVKLFTPLALSYWCLWALIQAQVSDIDFDYMSYAVIRFKEFKKLCNLL